MTEIAVWYLYVGIFVKHPHSVYPTEDYCKAAIVELETLYEPRRLRCLPFLKESKRRE